MVGPQTDNNVAIINLTFAQIISWEINLEHEKKIFYVLFDAMKEFCHQNLRYYFSGWDGNSARSLEEE